MKSEIIKSRAGIKRLPGPAFAFSFLFTGLGQIYNRDISKGIVFLILRILTLLIIPIFTLIQNQEYSFQLITAVVLIHVVVLIVSPFEAIYSAKEEKATNLKKYNSFIFYFLYSIISSALIIASVLILFVFFSLGKIHTNEMMPSLEIDEYVLINKHAADKANAGDIVFYSSKNHIYTGRVIAGEGNTITRKKNIYHINDSALKYDIIPKCKLESIGIDNSETLFYEVNGKKKYPVMLKSGKAKSDNMKPVLLRANEFFVVSDNRSSHDRFEVINANAILGKVECIIYSKRIKRILNRL